MRRYYDWDFIRFMAVLASVLIGIIAFTAYIFHEENTRKQRLYKKLTGKDISIEEVMLIDFRMVITQDGNSTLKVEEE